MIGLWLLIILVAFILMVCGVAAGIALLLTLISTVAFKTAFWICFWIVGGINIGLICLGLSKLLEDDDDDLDE